MSWTRIMNECSKEDIKAKINWVHNQDVKKREEARNRDSELSKTVA